MDEVTDTELILLKGHLLLESVIDQSLGHLVRRDGVDSLNISFAKKLQLLRLLHDMDHEQFLKIQAFTLQVNRLRNKLAHELNFDSSASEFERWANAVLDAFPATKISKYTFRTKIVHAFASLASQLGATAEVHVGRRAAKEGL
ncbi:hypothetical protein MW290_31420 [Aquincola tertiaricarbonis]|uniref:DUF4145 domain-containing protein n=1 Tax=Aquincola tertiaricarbonis TaxID=391953 RepID=A0ABY4SD47_AQUTE|nr:hypothetical protein [Aquincola tertiaricarbonis]URI10046.1 hypothetical protein MW290_31420 [Aquincola tertiaricarbonis]